MKILIIGAHPDDAEFAAGGTSRKFVRAGHEVKWISMTNGDAGHQTERGPDLAERRRREQWAASSVAGTSYQVLNHHDGRLYPTMEIRDEVVALIRAFSPDILMTHRPNDYHPDHRYTSLLVQDASYLLTVPAVVPREPHLRQMPVIVYLQDSFSKPYPFEPDVAVSIDDTIDDKIAMIDCHVSQVYEWLPYNRGIEKDVPADPAARKEWLGQWIRSRAAETANKYRTALKVLYGDKQGEDVRFAEAFEASEYGQALTAEIRKQLFPFFD